MGKKNGATGSASNGEAPRGRRGKPQSAREALGPMEPAASDAVLDVNEKLLRAAKGEIAQLLDDNWDDIISSYRQAIELHNEDEKDKKFKYKLPISLSITGQDPETYEVGAKIAFAVKRTDERTAQVKTGEGDLFPETLN